jgi:hypothetical protein
MRRDRNQEGAAKKLQVTERERGHHLLRPTRGGGLINGPIRLTFASIHHITITYEPRSQ